MAEALGVAFHDARLLWSLVSLFALSFMIRASLKAIGVRGEIHRAFFCDVFFESSTFFHPRNKLAHASRQAQASKQAHASKQAKQATQAYKNMYIYPARPTPVPPTLQKAF